MRIIHTGDINIRKNTDKKTFKRVFKFINEVKDSDADLLIIAGDIVASGLEEDSRKQRFLQWRQHLFLFVHL